MKQRFHVIPPPALARAQTELNRCLYVKESTFRGKDPTTGLYTIDVGEGLFSRIQYKAGDPIADFVGDFIDDEEWVRRDRAGKGGYSIRFPSGRVLDCYYQRMSGLCMASCANSALHCWNMKFDRMATNNAELRRDDRNMKARLYATATIPPETEISWPYSCSYRFEVR